MKRLKAPFSFCNSCNSIYIRDTTHKILVTSLLCFAPIFPCRIVDHDQTIFRQLLSFVRPRPQTLQAFTQVACSEEYYSEEICVNDCEFFLFFDQGIHCTDKTQIPMLDLESYFRTLLDEINPDIYCIYQ